MATIRQIIREVATAHGVQPWVVEKDYAISYLLAGIVSQRDFCERLVLKGGTALRKIYFTGFRFSEDLDFSTIELGEIKDIDAKIVNSLEIMTARLNEIGAFAVEHERMSLREPHPGGQVAYIVRVQFPYQSSPLCRLKIEITTDEPILLPPENQTIIHEFPERLNVAVLTYPLVEIVAEKLRALLQSEAKLAERGWGGARIPRAYYDLWYSTKFTNLSGSNLKDLVVNKSETRDVTFSSANDFFTPVLKDTAKSQWQKQLLPFLPKAPPVEVVLEELQNKLVELLD